MEPVIHSRKGLLVMSVNPLSLGLLASLGEIVGDAQPLGFPSSLGGSGIGTADAAPC